MAGPSAADWVSILLEHGAKLRSAGVAEIVAGEFRAVLHPPDLTPDKATGHQPMPHPDPLRDSATFHGGEVPTVPFVDEDNPFEVTR